MSLLLVQNVLFYYTTNKTGVSTIGLRR